MQPWKISVGFTVIILAVAAMVGGEQNTSLISNLTFKSSSPIIGWA